MKVFNRTSLQDTINYNGKVYRPNHNMTREVLRCRGLIPADKVKNCIVVNVLSTRLKGVNDLWGKPYQPTKWIYTC